MALEITRHARERMKKYSVSEEQIKEALDNPTNILLSYGNRRIYQKTLNGYVLRVIVEESKEIKGNKTIITVYKAKSGRYEIQI